MLHPGHRAAEQRRGERKLGAIARYPKHCLLRRAPRREFGMPYGGAIGAIRHMVEFGAALFVGRDCPRRVRDIDECHHVVVDVAADGGDARLVEHDRRRFLALFDFVFELLDLRERIDLMHRRVVVREHHMTALADRHHQRHEHLVALVDHRFVRNIRRRGQRGVLRRETHDGVCGGVAVCVGYDNVHRRGDGCAMHADDSQY